MRSFNARVKWPAGDVSSSIREVQSGFPVQSSTCDEYGAMVCRSGVLRSMSRPAGVTVQGHVGDGHVSVYGIVDCSREKVVKSFRRAPMREMRERRVRASIVEDNWSDGGGYGNLHITVGMGSARRLRSRGSEMSSSSDC